ncbi:hypothetical protein HA402_013731 [Bradysia odoriphaga]|nr:hypothetical protein HA402_013731 [Bradysia odoriphaga]
MTSPNFLDEIQEYIERYVGPSASEIVLNALIGGIAGYIGIKLARSSAAIIGTGLIIVEIISENGIIGFDRESTMDKCRRTFMDWFSLDEFYRRCAERGFLGGMLIGMSVG